MASRQGKELALPSVLLAMVFRVRDRRPAPPWPSVVAVALCTALWSVLFMGQALPREGSDITEGLCRSFMVLRKGVFLKIQQ